MRDQREPRRNGSGRSLQLARRTAIRSIFTTGWMPRDAYWKAAEQETWATSITMSGETRRRPPAEEHERRGNRGGNGHARNWKGARPAKSRSRAFHGRTRLPACWTERCLGRGIDYDLLDGPVHGVRGCPSAAAGFAVWQHGAGDARKQGREASGG